MPNRRLTKTTASKTRPLGLVEYVNNTLCSRIDALVSAITISTGFKF